MAALGDLNDDGHDDFAVIHWGVYIFHGPIEEPRAASDADAYLKIAGAATSPPIEPVGDVNGDGHGDLILGITDYVNGPAGAYLAFGPFEGDLELTEDEVVLLRADGLQYGATTDVESFPSPTDGATSGTAPRRRLPA